MSLDDTTPPIPEDHRRLVDELTVERYLAGRLPADEAERFERHYVDCPVCLDLLETTETLVEGLRHEAARETLASPPRAESSERRRRPSWRVPVLATAAALLLVAGLWRDHQLSRQVASLEQTVAVLQAPQDPLVVPLSPLRAVDGPDDEPPVRRLRLPAEDRLVLFTLELGLQPGQAYALTVEDSRGRPLWRQADLSADDDGRLSLAFRASFFEPGTVTLRVDSAAGSPVARLPLEVLPAR